MMQTDCANSAGDNSTVKDVLCYEILLQHLYGVLRSLLNSTMCNALLRIWGPSNSSGQLLDAPLPVQQLSHAGLLTCQCGSKTGREASQPAVAACFPVLGPQPSCGCMLKAQSAERTVEGRSPDAPASSATIWPAQASLLADGTLEKTTPGERQANHAQARSASFRAADLRERLHTLMPCGAGLEALLHIPMESILQTSQSTVRGLS